MNVTKQKQTHGCREPTSGYKWGEVWGERKDWGRELRGTNYYV